MAGMSRAVKVGVFLVGGIVLFCVGLFLVGTRADLFGNRFTVYTAFNNIDTIQTGAKVRVGGMDAGDVTNIEVPKNPSQKFRLALQVDKKFRPLIRQDSLASLETEGMVGNIFVNIAKGSASSPECQPGCTLPSQESVSMGQMMRKASEVMGTVQSTIQDLRTRADTVMENLASATGNANQLIVAAKPNIVQLTKNANAIAAGIREGHGTAGKLLTDKTMAANVSQTIANAKEASSKVNAMITTVQQSDLPKVHQTLANTQAMTAKMNKAVGSLLAKGKNNQGTMVALRQTIQQAHQTTANLADDTEAIKHNFFFRGFFNRRGYYSFDTMTPSKYEASEFVKKPKARVWVPADGVFTTGANGAQQLTDEGKAILDKAMSGLTPYLPNNPVVVEGYSTKGAPDQQYLESRQRALAARAYLQQKFHLDPKRAGVMPFGAHPPKGTGRQTWDGLCLVLVESKKQ